MATRARLLALPAVQRLAALRRHADDIDPDHARDVEESVTAALRQCAPKPRPTPPAPAPPVKIKAGADILKAMDPTPWHVRAGRAVFHLTLFTAMASLFAWLTYREILHVVYG